MRILVTGAAGFIGANLVERLLTTETAVEVVGLDSVNDYYDVTLKEFRLNRLTQIAAAHPENKWTFVKGNLADKALIDRIFAEYAFDVVVNLAAQAGVRYSITNPDAYIESNLIGFYNILEACRHSYDDGIVTVDPTCETEGTIKFVCENCEMVYPWVLAGKPIDNVLLSGEDC